MRFSLGLLSSTQGIETLQEDEITIAGQINQKLSICEATLFDKLYNDLRTAVSCKQYITYIFYATASTFKEFSN